MLSNDTLERYVRLLALLESARELVPEGRDADTILLHIERALIATVAANNSFANKVRKGR